MVNLGVTGVEFGIGMDITFSNAHAQKEEKTT